VVVYANHIGLRQFYRYVVNIGRWSPYEGGQLDRFHCIFNYEYFLIKRYAGGITESLLWRSSVSRYTVWGSLTCRRDLVGGGRGSSVWSQPYLLIYENFKTFAVSLGRGTVTAMKAIDWSFSEVFLSSQTSWSPPLPRLWRKCNRLLKLGRSVGAVTLSRWEWWWNERWIWGARGGLKPNFY